MLPWKCLQIKLKTWFKITRDHYIKCILRIKPLGIGWFKEGVRLATKYRRWTEKY